MHAGAAHLAKVTGKGRTGSHVRNQQLYTTEILRFFGPATSFRDLDQARADAYLDFARAQTVKVWKGGNRKAGDAAIDAAENWRDTGRRRSPRQVNNYLKCLRKLLALAAKVRDPATRLPALEATIEIELESVPKRKPRPIPDGELAARQAHVPPWTRDQLELSRLFGLRKTETLAAGRRHIDRERKGLAFKAGETKSRQDEFAFGGAEGWRLLLRLEQEAIARGQDALITWPGPEHQHLVLAGGPIPDGVSIEWRPMKTLGNAWRRSAKRAGIEDPHRYHDVRARYITEVAKVSKVAAKGAARHQASSTTDLYIGIADSEVGDAVAQAMARRPKARKLKVVK